MKILCFTVTAKASRKGKVIDWATDNFMISKQISKMALIVFAPDACLICTYMFHNKTDVEISLCGAFIALLWP